MCQGTTWVGNIPKGLSAQGTRTAGQDHDVQRQVPTQKVYQGHHPSSPGYLLSLGVPRSLIRKCSAQTAKTLCLCCAVLCAPCVRSLWQCARSVFFLCCAVHAPCTLCTALCTLFTLCSAQCALCRALCAFCVCSVRCCATCWWLYSHKGAALPATTNNLSTISLSDMQRLARGTPVTQHGTQPTTPAGTGKCHGPQQKHLTS